MTRRRPGSEPGLRREPWISRVVFCAASLCWLGIGCAAGSGAARSDSPPAVRAVDAARDAIDRSSEAAFESSEDRDSYRVALRYNPTRWAGPDFEVRIHGRWTRVWLEASGETAERIRSYREKMEEDRSTPLDVAGRPSGRREAENGVSYPVFSIAELEPES